MVHSMERWPNYIYNNKFTIIVIMTQRKKRDEPDAHGSHGVTPITA